VAITEQNHNIAGIQAVYGVRPGCEEEDGIEDEQKGMRVESQIGMKELMSLPHLLQGLYLVLLSSLCNTYDNRRRGSVPLNHRSSGIVHLKHSELWYCPPQSFGALVSSTSIVRSSGIVHLNYRRCGRNVLLNRSSGIVHLTGWRGSIPQPHHG
jgi:hypothetical protein